MLSKKGTEAQIRQHIRRLEKLKEQQARLGINTSPEILNEIEDIEEKLAELQKELEVFSDDVSNDVSVKMDHVRLIFDDFDTARSRELIDVISNGLGIQRQSVQIIDASATEVVLEMPAEAAREVITLTTPEAKRLGGKLMFEFSARRESQLLTDKQREEQYLKEARKFITECCLIAADVDKTLIDQTGDRSSERQIFGSKIAPSLIEAARMGTHIAVITGNSMNQLTSRFFSWLIGKLVFDRDIIPLARFHLFCNSGGIYIRFDPDSPVFERAGRKLGPTTTRDEIIEEFILAEPDRDTKSIHPRFIDSAYINRTAIAPQDVPEIVRILEEVSREFQQKLIQELDQYENEYRINHPEHLESSQNKVGHLDGGLVYELFDKAGQPIMPQVDPRPIRYGQNEPYHTATVQITVSPILSFRHANKPETLFGRDFRGELTEAIQSELDRRGFNQYVARPGGRSSIDVTLEKVDKAYAVRFLIDHLNLEGSSRLGKEFGSNAIYFGDEVIVGDGNDYSVTRIPGLLVFAVNEDRDLVPLLSRVFVPSAIVGPRAVAKELTKFTAEAEKLLDAYCSAKRAGKTPATKTAVEALKERIFVNRIKEKINNWDISSGNVSAKNLELMHVLVTLMSREDPVAHHWLSILVDELNAIMTYLKESEKKDIAATIKAIGHSYDD